MIRNFFLLILSLGIIFTSCQKKETKPDENIPDIEKLNIPADFDFSTTRTVDLTISDGENGATYAIYSLKSTTPEEVEYSDDDTIVVMDNMNARLASGIVKNGTLEMKITMPAYHQYLYIVRNKDGIFHRESVKVDGNTLNYTYSGFKNSKAFSGNKVTTDFIYAVNGYNKDIYRINMDTHELEKIGENDYYSNAAAIDPVNERLYIVNKSAPYQLGYYDLNTGQFTNVGHLFTNIPRMDYNVQDGFLYISKKSTLYRVDPSNGQVIQSFHIQGLADDTWGDLAFAEDGTMYILCNSGVYKSTINGNTVQTVEVSNNSLPRNLTSIVVGSNGLIYMTKYNTSGGLIELDPATGDFNYIQVNQTVNVNDFAILRANNPVGNDSDGDGVPDDQDDYPNDPERAFNNYFPGEGLWATLAFEDLWPSKGDYDFNDMVVGYNFNQVTNANNEVVDIIAKFDMKHNGAGLHNAFAFQVPVDATNVGSVTTDYSPTGTISLNGNGTIANQDLTNILVFEDNWEVDGTEINLTVNFSTPVPATQAGTPPYNPYLIKNGDQSVEVHLPDMEPTQLADQTLFGTDDDTSNPATGRYYKTATNLPWAINIVYDFEWMKEKVEIVDGYLHFSEWAESGGTQFQDWYKDLPGYRNESLIDN